jgi:hypothetical protein
MRTRNRTHVSTGCAANAQSGRPLEPPVSDPKAVPLSPSVHTRRCGRMHGHYPVLAAESNSSVGISGQTNLGLTVGLSADLPVLVFACKCLPAFRTFKMGR